MRWSETSDSAIEILNQILYSARWAGIGFKSIKLDSCNYRDNRIEFEHSMQGRTCTKCPRYETEFEQEVWPGFGFFSTCLYLAEVHDDCWLSVLLLVFKPCMEIGRFTASAVVQNEKEHWQCVHGELCSTFPSHLHNVSCRLTQESG